MNSLIRRVVMRKLLVSLAAAGTALAFATPATAQYFPQPAYGAPYGNAYGYRNNVGRWQREIQQIRIPMDNLGRSGRLARAEAVDLDRDIRTAERSIYRSGRGGIAPWEAQNIDGRIWHLRNELRRYADYDGRRGGWRRY